MGWTSRDPNCAAATETGVLDRGAGSRFADVIFTAYKHLRRMLDSDVCIYHFEKFNV